MTGYRHGLVVGKFYPPHAGHHYLIRNAASHCTKVSVIVAASQFESIPLAERLAWLREEHTAESNVEFTGIIDDAPVDFESAQAWAAHHAVFDTALRRNGDDRIDAVFSSEKYGDELAAHHSAVHVEVDRARATHSVSGAACRSDLAATWGDLAPATRAGLTTRLVVVGAESTGTTTVGRALAHRFQGRGGIWALTRWVPEYGRERSQEKFDVLRATDPAAAMNDVSWVAEDFAHIATVQTEREEAAARAGSPLLVCDTDAFATQVWERRYLGAHSSAAASVSVPHHDAYLVTDHVGVPFVQDGLRDGEHIRQDMTRWFLDALTATERSCVLLTGSLDDRVDLACAVADNLLRLRSTLSDPLG
jgi:HTH-type transcriptional regulator, transcriptional repressor of NAD biosynthesis genes